jgi:hypothetical protein
MNVSTGAVDSSVHTTSTNHPASVEWDQDTSRPGSRANDVPGLADQKDTRRLMNIMPPCPRGGQT